MQFNSSISPTGTSRTPIPQENKEAQKLNNVPLKISCAQLYQGDSELKSENIRLRKENESLRMQVQIGIHLMKDEELRQEMEERPFFTKFFDDMLGNNSEYEDLQKAGQQVKHFRENLQKRMDLWKAQFDIHITLDQEMHRFQEPINFPKKIPELVMKVTSEIEQDLVIIFKNVEDNFKQRIKTSELLSDEIRDLNNLLMEKDDELSALKKEVRQESWFARYEIVNKSLAEYIQKEREWQIEEECLKNNILKLEQKLEIEKADKYQLKQNFVLIQSETDSLKLQFLELEKKLKLSEGEIIKLESGIDFRSYSQETIDQIEAQLHNIRAQLKTETSVRQKAEIEWENQKKDLGDLILVEHKKFKLEESHRVQLEQEIKRLQERSNNYDKLIRAESEMEDVIKRNAFMIKFIKSQPEDLQNLFRDQFLKVFKD